MKFRRNCRVPQHEGTVPLLRIIEKMVARRAGKFTEQFLVLQHAVQQGARRRHAADAGFILINGFGQQMEGLRVAFESAPGTHQLLQGPFARVAEGRMA